MRDSRRFFEFVANRLPDLDAERKILFAYALREMRPLLKGIRLEWFTGDLHRQTYAAIFLATQTGDVEHKEAAKQRIESLGWTKRGLPALKDVPGLCEGLESRAIRRWLFEQVEPCVVNPAEVGGLEAIPTQLRVIANEIETKLYEAKHGGREKAAQGA